ncbi:TPA: GTPase [Yersinia enterocolitica]|uniref:GTPase n=1 Tax=Yersinia TaxID=629 RepID=UPI001C609BEC|nr:GTPase [Yersinia kristensenii]ELI7901188.1 50S ribosome-binding GTPase [Yersinia enterocolitica]ELI8002680.1 50S ribosome-binding GTPase [Yersinia enterocolitica]ELX2216126.1 50S ribosome-binding GTPase [Yersinia enterocolitica]MBW5824673.1 50S ribosome-binding GTPase [Yersinia kristensenii]HEB1858578.1 50S ribosome-binding GTPase [Yersinia enterocolitica]
MTDQNSYLASLDTCKRIAKEEYKTVQGHFEQCDNIIGELSKKLQCVIEHGSQTLSEDKMVEDGLTNMLQDLEKDYGKLLSKRNANLAKQKRSLDYFNVMLFGRTMAGKSTIREAITQGDGQTIGKGAQRTTRDVKEYEWKNLRIIDTPGFGAYNGQEDTQVAHEILEQSDVVLFMLNSDSIQESTFVELEHIYKLNKPLIFVLNMKKDLENDGNRRRALKNPEKYIFKEEDIQGHTDRLKNLAGRVGINPSAVRIIPIHAQAAFLATRVPGEEGSQLHELSRIDKVLNALIDEVEGNGPIRRVQTFLDSSLHHVDEQSLLILSQRDQLTKLLPQYESSLTRISQWRVKTLRDAPRLLSKEVDFAFKPLIDSVPDFVDDQIENDNAAGAWERHYKSLNITKKIEQSVQALAEQVVEELYDFNREMNEGLDITLSFEVGHNGQNFSESDFKRINGWGSAIAGVVSSIAFSNSWNPVGWVAAGIGIVFAIFSFFSDSRAKKLKEAKSKQRKALLEDIEKSKKKIKDNLEDWFEINIHRATILPAENNLSLLCQTLSKFINELDSVDGQLYVLKHDINFRLLNQVAYVITKKHFVLPRFIKVVRIPGYACYFLVSEYFRNTELLIAMGKSMREKIIAVYDASLDKKILHLYKGLVDRVEISGKNTISVFVQEKNLSKIIGKDHRRIKMVATLCSCEITPITI